MIDGMDEQPEQRNEPQGYEKWARSVDRFWGRMKCRESIGLIVMVLFVIIWLVFDLPKHLFQ